MSSTSLTRLLVAAALVAAMVPASTSAETVEITPFVGYRFGGEFVSEFDEDEFDDADVEGAESFGLFLGFAVADGWKIELIYDTQETEVEVPRGLFGRNAVSVDIDYLQVGGSYEWNWDTSVRPYVAASIGAADFGFDGGEDETRFASSVGGGVKIMPNDNFGVRFDGRWYWAFVEEDDELVCGQNGCLVFDDTTLLFQWDVKVGLVFSF